MTDDFFRARIDQMMDLRHPLAALAQRLSWVRRILAQGRKGKEKPYALRAPEVECISKGKARRRCEFGVKVAVAVTHKGGLIIGARSFPGNPP